jgi:putative phage-type endonuclease
MGTQTLQQPSSKPRPALRLVGTKQLPREDWLAVRKQGLGSSDAAAAVGLNPYKSQLELWLEKTGRDSSLPKVDPQDEESPAYWGNILEPIVATHYTRRSGHRIRRVNAVLQHPDPNLTWMLANIDREVIGASDVQLAVTGKPAADVAVLLGGQHLEIHRIERDDSLIARLIDLERLFWDYVVSDTPPPADGSTSADQALRCLYPKDNGQNLDFSQDTRLCTIFTELQNVRESIALQEKQEAQLKQTLQQAIGDASRATFATGCITWKKAKDSVALDLPRLLKEKPYLQVRYATTKTGSRRFLLV